MKNNVEEEITVGGVFIARAEGGVVRGSSQTR